MKGERPAAIVGPGPNEFDLAAEVSPKRHVCREVLGGARAARRLDDVVAQGHGHPFSVPRSEGLVVVQVHGGLLVREETAKTHIARQLEAKAVHEVANAAPDALELPRGARIRRHVLPWGLACLHHPGVGLP